MRYRVNWPDIGQLIKSTANYLGPVWSCRRLKWSRKEFQSTATRQTRYKWKRKSFWPSLPSGNSICSSPIEKLRRYQLESTFSSISIFVNEKTGKVKQEGDIVKNPALAQTLRTIARDGVGVLYNGTLGDRLVEDIQRKGGIITKQDLMQYR